ncbi:MAG: aminomethyltransferase family protein [Dehalococcoidia bacterium]
MRVQRSPLHAIQEELGASFEEWYGWDLPAWYGTGEQEYAAIQGGAALVDRSYLGRLQATGKDVLDLLNRLSTNRVVDLLSGEAVPTVLTTERGRIIDLVSVANLGDSILVVTSPQTRGQVAQWIDRYTFLEEVAVEDVTPDTALLTLLGPGSPELVQGVLGAGAAALAPWRSTPALLDGLSLQVLRTDPLGVLGYDLLVGAEEAERLFRHLLEAGEPLGLRPVGMVALELLRLRRGWPVHGKELGEAYNPLEAGLKGAISFTKGCYIGQEVVARLDTYQKVQRQLVVLAFDGSAVQEGDRLLQEDREAGRVTSAARYQGQSIGLGYIRLGATALGNRLAVSGREGTTAKVVALAQPFGPGEE